MKSDVWIEEKHKDTYATRFKVNKVLFSGKSKFQSVDIVETASHGRMLLNDGLVMISERDEHIYHEMIAHVPLFTHPNPKKVLIIGGGDGGTAREVLRHPIEKCVMVEIDAMVVDACKEHIPQTASVLEGEPRLELRIEDGVKYVKETKEKFDVILVDSTDPIGPAAPLFGEDFYQDLEKCLSPDGIVVSQGEGPFFYEEEQQSLLKILGSVFPKTSIYNFVNLTYPGGLWSFTYASNGLDPVKDYRSSDAGQMTGNYYNEELHKAAFVLPEFMKKSVQKLLKD